MAEPSKKPKLLAMILILPGLAYAAKGAWILTTGEMWSSPKYSVPVLVQGPAAIYGGIAHILGGLAVVSALSAALSVPKKPAISAAAVLGLGAFGCLVASLMMN